MTKRRMPPIDDVADEVLPPRRRRGKAAADADDPFLLATTGGIDLAALSVGADSMLAAASQQLADQIGPSFDPYQAFQRVLGVPMPGLAMQYALRVDCWPLQRVTELYGLEGAGKTSLLLEILRWHLMYAGAGVVIDTENKSAAGLALSALNHDRVLFSRVRMDEGFTLQEWQQKLTAWQATFEKGEKDRPLLLAVDSLMAAADEENIDRIEKDGSSGRQHPSEALKISAYAKMLPKWTSQLPASYIVTNHLKPATENGMPVDRVPGGKAIKYYATKRLKVTRMKRLHLAAYNGNRLRINVIKNSVGEAGRHIDVEMIWRSEVDPATGMPVQKTLWDWNLAAIELLLRQKEDDKTAWQQISELVDLHPVSGRRLWSATLGIPKEQPVRYTEAGAILETRDDLMRPLQSILGIRRMRPFLPGISLEKQVAKAITCDISEWPQLPRLPNNAFTDEEFMAVGDHLRDQAEMPQVARSSDYDEN